MLEGSQRELRCLADRVWAILVVGLAVGGGETAST